MSENDTAYACVLPFDNDEPGFVRGFEAGRLWEMLKHHEEPFEQEIHGTNAEMVLRMAESCARTVEAEIVDDTWMFLRVEEAPCR